MMESMSSPTAGGSSPTSAGGNGNGSGGTTATPSASSQTKRWSVIVNNPMNDYGSGRTMETTYQVSTEKTSVRRRYIDFCWLYDRLLTEYPGAIVPIITHRNKITLPNQKFQPEFIQERINNLQKFISTVVSHDELSNAPSMTPFMTCTIEQLEEAKKTIESMNPTGSIGGSLSAGDEEGSGHDLSLQGGGTSASGGADGSTPASSGGGGGGRFGKGLANMFAKAATIARVSAGNVELEETKEEPELIAMKNYITEVEQHMKQLLTTSTALVKSTNDIYNNIHAFGVPFSNWKDSHLNHIVANIEMNSGELGDDDPCMKHMKTIVNLSDNLSGIKEQQHSDEKTKFELIMEQIAYDVKAFQLALKKRRQIQIAYTTKQKQINDKTIAIDKVKAKNDPKNSDKLIVKLEMEKMELETESTKLKDLLLDTSARALRETKKYQPLLERHVVQCVVEYGKIQIHYNEKLSKVWKKTLPKLGDSTYQHEVDDTDDDDDEPVEEVKPPTITSV